MTAKAVTALGTIWELRTDFYPGNARALWEALGYIPHWLNAADPRSATQQLDAGYARHGGWHPFPGFSLVDGIALKYPEDPLLYPYATCEFRDERVIIYPSAMVCVVHADRSFEVARMD